VGYFPVDGENIWHMNNAVSLRNLIFKVAVCSLSVSAPSVVASNGITEARNDLGFQCSKFRSQSNQTSERVSKTNDKDTMQAILDDNAQVEKVADGFDFIEGPVWYPKGFLLFSDIPANTIYRWTPNEKPGVFRQPSGNANGNTLDREGRLISAEHGNRRVSRTLEDGTVVTLASQYEGKRLNSPNDVVVKSDGSIYFTDPPYGIKSEQEELGFYGVYRIAPDGKLTLLVRDFVRPNGIAFSPDEKKLYIDDSEKGHIRVFDVKPDGTLDNGRIFAELKDPNKNGVPDGMKVDVEGNVYSTGPGGVWVFSPSGNLLGTIEVPEVTTNLAWGLSAQVSAQEDRDYKTLYITANKSLYRIRLKIPGVRPGEMKR
jgi:gluconolactonase